MKLVIMPSSLEVYKINTQWRSRIY